MNGSINLKNLIALCVVGLVAFIAYSRFEVSLPRASIDHPLVAGDFGNPGDGSEVDGSGTVVRILPDDVEGDRHQRFILRLSSGRTLLVAHNIDIAPRVAPLHEGDTIVFRGEYESNSKGGVVHWTHHDPSGRHPAGWLKHDGQTFQ